MKRRIISIMAVLVLLCGTTMMQSAKAQNIIDEEKELKLKTHGKSSKQDDNLNNISLEERDGDISLETFVPLSGGILVLGCLGGAYLIGKKRKDQDS